MLIMPSRPLARIMAALPSLKFAAAGEQWDLAYYGRGAQTPTNATAKNTRFIDLLLRNVPIGAFTADRTNYPTVKAGNNNDYTHLLVKCWNPTWVSMYGQYLVIPLADYLPNIKRSQWTSNTRNTKTRRKVWLREAGWQSVDNFMLTTGTEFSLWDTDGISPNSGGYNVVGTKTALVLTNGFLGNEHYDNQAYFEIYLGKITDPLFMETRLDFQAEHRKDLYKETVVATKPNASYTSIEGKPVLYLPHSNRDSVELDPVPIGANEDFTIDWEGRLGPYTDRNHCIMSHWSNTNNGNAACGWLIYTKSNNVEENIVLYVVNGLTMAMLTFNSGVKAPIGRMFKLRVARRAGILRFYLDGVKVGPDHAFSGSIHSPPGVKIRATWDDPGDSQSKYIHRMRVATAAAGTVGYNASPSNYLEHTLGYPNFGSSDFTIRARIRRVVNKQQIIVSRGSNTNNNGTEWVFGVNDANKLLLAAGVRNVNNFVLYGEDILLTENREYEVAVVRLSGVTKLYIDGKLLKVYSNNSNTTLPGIPSTFTTPVGMAFSIGTFVPDRSGMQSVLTVRDLKITTRAEFNGDYPVGQNYITPLDALDSGVLTAMPLSGSLTDYGTAAKTFTAVGTVGYNWND